MQKKYMIFQVIFGLIGINHVFGGSAHISGATHGHSQLAITHISGGAYLGSNLPKVKIHVSGAKIVIPLQQSEPLQSNVLKKARNIEVTLGAPEKSFSTQVGEKATEQTKTNTVADRIAEETSLSSQIKQRKACWKSCEDTWKVNSQDRCFTLSGLRQQNCKKKLFKERLTCVSRNCREFTQ